MTYPSQCDQNQHAKDDRIVYNEKQYNVLECRYILIFP